MEYNREQIVKVQAFIDVGVRGAQRAIERDTVHGEDQRGAGGRVAEQDTVCVCHAWWRGQGTEAQPRGGPNFLLACGPVGLCARSTLCTGSRRGLLARVDYPPEPHVRSALGCYHVTTKNDQRR